MFPGRAKLLVLNLRPIPSQKQTLRPAERILSLVNFMLDILILANVVGLLDNAAHEHFLSDETNDEGTYQQEKLLEASQVSQKGQDVRYLTIIVIIHFVSTDVQTYNVTV